MSVGRIFVVGDGRRTSHAKRLAKERNLPYVHALVRSDIPPTSAVVDVNRTFIGELPVEANDEVVQAPWGK